MSRRRKNEQGIRKGLRGDVDRRGDARMKGDKKRSQETQIAAERSETEGRPEVSFGRTH